MLAFSYQLRPVPTKESKDSAGQQEDRGGLEWGAGKGVNGWERRVDQAQKGAYPILLPKLKAQHKAVQLASAIYADMDLSSPKEAAGLYPG